MVLVCTNQADEGALTVRVGKSGRSMLNAPDPPVAAPESAPNTSDMRRLFDCRPTVSGYLPEIVSGER